MSGPGSAAAPARALLALALAAALAVASTAWPAKPKEKSLEERLIDWVVASGGEVRAQASATARRWAGLLVLARPRPSPRPPARPATL